jgi:hypothetical protein
MYINKFKKKNLKKYKKFSNFTVIGMGGSSLGTGNLEKSGGITRGDFFSTKNSSVLFFLGFWNPFFTVPHEFKSNKAKYRQIIILNFLINILFWFTK